MLDKSADSPLKKEKKVKKKKNEAVLSISNGE